MSKKEREARKDINCSVEDFVRNNYSGLKWYQVRDAKGALFEVGFKKDGKTFQRSVRSITEAKQFFKETMEKLHEKLKWEGE